MYQGAVVRLVFLNFADFKSIDHRGLLLKLHANGIRIHWLGRSLAGKVNEAVSEPLMHINDLLPWDFSSLMTRSDYES